MSSKKVVFCLQYFRSPIYFFFVSCVNLKEVCRMVTSRIAIILCKWNSRYGPQIQYVFSTFFGHGFFKEISSYENHTGHTAPSIFCKFMLLLFRLFVYMFSLTYGCIYLTILFYPYNNHILILLGAGAKERRIK